MIIETLHNEQRTMREEETSRYVHHPARRYELGAATGTQGDD